MYVLYIISALFVCEHVNVCTEILFQVRVVPSHTHAHTCTRTHTHHTVHCIARHRYISLLSVVCHFDSNFT